MSYKSGFILPVGTKIVLLEDIIRNDNIILNEGMVGVIQQSPLDNTHNYLVRFPDGDETGLKRRQFAIQKHYRREGMEQTLDDHNLYDYVIFRVIVGSRAFGLDTEESDTDRRGVFICHRLICTGRFMVYRSN